MKNAFANEDVPALDDRIRAWSDYRHRLARYELPILVGGLVITEEGDALQSANLHDPIAWFEGVEANLSVDDEDDDPDEDITGRAMGRVAAQNAFVRAVRGRALTLARRRAPGRSTRQMQILDWIEARGIALPDFTPLGRALLVAGTARRLTRSPDRFVRDLPLRYRRFRRARQGGEI